MGLADGKDMVAQHKLARFTCRCDKLVVGSQPAMCSAFHLPCRRLLEGFPHETTLAVAIVLVVPQPLGLGGLGSAESSAMPKVLEGCCLRLGRGGEDALSAFVIIMYVSIMG